jgi:rod shape-determining protein MreC
MLDIRQRTGYLFLAVMVGHVILISAQVQTREGGRVLEMVTFSLFAEVQRGGAALIDGWRGVWSGYVWLRGLRAENEALKQRVSELQVRLQEERALAQRSQRLQALLDLRSRVTMPTLAAEVIAGDATPGIPGVWINKGERDGVRADMAVIAPSGVVGRVFGPLAPHAARVQLVIGPNAGAGAMIERSRAGGVIVGRDGDPPLLMEYVSNLGDVRPGDLVVTAGTDGIYPKGFAIGRVETAERGAGLYRTITVRPVVDFSNIEEVLVVLTPPATPERGSGRDAGPPATSSLGKR